MPMNQISIPLTVAISAGSGIQNQAGGQFADGIVSEILGKYYYLTRLGVVFNLSTLVGGVAIPISTATAQTFGVWNTGSKAVNCVPLLYLASYVSGTTVGGAIGISRLPNAGSAIGAAGAPITAWTDTTPVNQLMGGPTGAIRGTLTATTIAATWFQTLGISEYAAVAASAITGSQYMYDFHGSLIIPPNNAAFVTASAASGALLSQTLLFAELPL